MTDAEFARRLQEMQEWILEHWDEKGMLDWLLDKTHPPKQEEDDD